MKPRAHFSVQISTLASSPAWGGTWSLAIANSNKDPVLGYNAVPEPQAVLLGMPGMLSLLRRRR